MNNRIDTLPLELSDAFESQLQSSLNPVRPDPEFIYRLHMKLESNPTVVIEHRSSAKAFLIMSLALFSGAFLVWIFRRIR
jgi:hypothetical protein